MIRRRNYIKIAGIATALEPIVHGGERDGTNIAGWRKEKIRVGDGWEYLPVAFSANAVGGGVIRNNCAEWCIDQLPKFKEFAELRAFDLITAGGTLVSAKKDGKTADKYINLFEEHELREMFLILGLLGGSVGNRVLGGRLDVADWVVICQETKHYLPEYLGSGDAGDDATNLHALADKVSIADCRKILDFTTNDRKKDRHFQDLIKPEVLHQWQREQAARVENDKAREHGDSMSMIYGYESLARGTQFYVEFMLRNPSELELGAFFGALTYFMERPKIGGRQARGCGLVRLELDQYHMVGPAAIKDETPLAETALRAMDAASQHLQEREAQILEAFRPGAL